MRLLVRIVSLLGGLLYLIPVTLFLSIGPVSDGAGGESGNPVVPLLMFCPLAYFAVCFWTSFARLRKMEVLLVGLAGHACLAVSVVVAFYAGDIGGIFLTAGLVCSALWGGMYLSLDKITDTAPESSSCAQKPDDAHDIGGD